MTQKPDIETMVDKRIVFVGVRMPEELNDLIKDRAGRAGRSVNKQILHYLESVPDLQDKSTLQEGPDQQTERYRLHHKVYSDAPE